MSNFLGQKPISKEHWIPRGIQPSVTCSMESYLVFRFSVEVVSLFSSGIGCNQHRGEKVEHLSTAGTMPSKTSTTVTPLPAVATGNQGPPIPGAVRKVTTPAYPQPFSWPPASSQTGNLPL